MDKTRFYFGRRDGVSRFLNRWDMVLFILLLSILFFLGWAGKQMASPYQLGSPLPISLSLSALPFYAARTVSRLFIALFFSLLFTFVVGALAAKNRRAEQIVVPAIDILQSVPVLSFLSITVTGFIWLFPNSLLGPECASIFAIFTAQVWNMVFGFYQSLKTLPFDLKEASIMFHLSRWQRFWKVEVPFAMPGLLWNMMMSMSASWFFVVLSEFISVAHQDIYLPGLGSYIAVAIAKQNIHAVFYAIVTMIFVIFLYDQIIFRPLIVWSEKFRMEEIENDEGYQSWLIDFLHHSQLMRKLSGPLAFFKEHFVNARFLSKVTRAKIVTRPSSFYLYSDWIWNIVLWGGVGMMSFKLYQFVLTELQLQDIWHVFLLGAATGLRVIILIILGTIVWVPVGVWIGLRPKVSQMIQPIIQFAAAFPANLFYPLFVIMILRFHLNVEIWVTPLMILGTQWYILFNVIAGASTIPRDLYLASNNLGLHGWLWWKRLALPGIFPFLVTGAITAAGGAWNASIVAECVSWGQVTLRATGLGEYIQSSTVEGDFQKIALGTGMMCFYVLLFNHVIWRPLYRLAEDRFRIY